MAKKNILPLIPDEYILESNNGNIIAGDYVIMSGGIVTISFDCNGINSVNIILEKDGEDFRTLTNDGGLVIANNTTITFSWVCDIVPTDNEPYPVYRIKIESISPKGIVSYSNYFKISVKL